MKRDRTTTETPVEDEGARGFGVLLQQLDDGAVHADLSETLRKVAGELSDIANQVGKAKGTVTLKLSLAAEDNGMVFIDAEIASKTPKMKHARAAFWLTKGNNLTPENPRQQKLPLREVAPPAVARDIAHKAEGAPRSV
jgi:hypothetical protein